MIPQGQYDPRRAQVLLEFLQDELRTTMSDRKTKEDKWLRYQEVYRAEPDPAPTTFPFVGASKIVVPVVATDVDTMYARMMGMLFDPANLWSLEALSPEWSEVAPRVEEFLKWAQHNELNLTQPIGDWLLETFKLGTGVLKQRYNREMKKVFEWRELDAGVFQQQLITLLKDNPAVDHVRLRDFYVPAGFTQLQTAPWCAERITLTQQRYANRVRAGLYQPINTEVYARQANRMEQELQRVAGFKRGSSRNLPLEIYECWTDFDLLGDGWDTAVVATIHPDCNFFLRLDFNPFFNQDKPYSVARMMRDETSFYGLGLCDMLDQFQEEITAMHRQRLDNGTIANSQMFAVNKRNKNIRADEPVYTGKIWLVEDPRDVQPVAMSSVAPTSSIPAEQSTLQYSQRRTGVNDYVYGQPSPEIGYGTAYTTQVMQQNSTRRQGETLREIRAALSETGARVLELYQQFNQRGKEYFAVGAVDGNLVRQVLQFPLDLIRKGLRVNVTAIDVQQNKETQIRTNTLLMQITMQFYQQYMQALSYVVNPQVPPPIQQAAMQMVQGGSILMRRLLDLYGVQDIDKILPLADSVNQQQAQLQELQRLTLIGTGSGGAAVPGQFGGMGGVPQAGQPRVPGGQFQAPPGVNPTGVLPPPGQAGGYGVNAFPAR